jgi:hypothetical protein
MRPNKLEARSLMIRKERMASFPDIELEWRRFMAVPSKYPATALYWKYNGGCVARQCATARDRFEAALHFPQMKTVQYSR